VWRGAGEKCGTWVRDNPSYRMSQTLLETKYGREEIRSGRYGFNELFEKFDRMYEANEISYERREKLRKVVLWVQEASKHKKE